jgi:hypothetical protein
MKAFAAVLLLSPAALAIFAATANAQPDIAILTVQVHVARLSPYVLRRCLLLTVLALRN